MKEFFNYEMYNQVLNGRINTIPSLIDYLKAKGARNVLGNSYILHPKNCNLIIWPNVSEELISCLNEFQARYPDICYYNDNLTPLVYMLNGTTVALPLIKGGRIDYQTPHWFPIIITSEKKIKESKKHARHSRTIQSI